MTNQTKTDNLNYLVDPTFTKANRSFVLSFKNEKDRTSYSECYTPTMEITDFNVLVDGKRFFDVPVKNREEAYEKIIEISKNNDYTTGNLLDYEYFSKQYKLIAIDLSKQIELENPDLKQQINFIGKLKENNATMFLLLRKKKLLLIFHRILLISHVPVKNREEAYEKIIEISKNNDYTTGNLLDYEYFSKQYKLIAIDLSKQIELENPDLKQQINFIGKLKENNATMFLLLRKKKLLLIFHRILLISHKVEFKQ